MATEIRLNKATIGKERRTPVLIPDMEEDRAKLAKFGDGETVKVSIKLVRNPLFHRKYFALLKVIAENLPDQLAERYNIDPAEPETLRHDIKLKLGLYDLWVTEEGNAVFIPQSMSFDAMDQIEFEKIYSRTIDLALSRYLKGSTEQEIDRMVNAVLGYT